MRCIRFKSDRCGIETNNAMDTLRKDYEFKSDRCGIETRESINHNCEFLLRSNQTVAGLKQTPAEPAPKEQKRFKSDRCGIETLISNGLKTIDNLFKSDRCGIETSLLRFVRATFLCSNQTVAGLKLLQRRSLVDWGLSVQIRPLRD